MSELVSLVVKIKRLEKENKDLKEENENLKKELNAYFCKGQMMGYVNTFLGKPVEYWIKIDERINMLKTIAESEE